MASTPTLKKNPWWLTNGKIVERRISDARSLIAKHQPSDVLSAITHLDAALALSPRHDAALELKARCLLFLRRFKDVADLLVEHIPSFAARGDDVEEDMSGSMSSRERVRLIERGEGGEEEERGLWCFSVSEIRKRVLAGICDGRGVEGYWRYIVLGQACCHLGMLNDAVLLLQTGKRLATASLRHTCQHMRDDDFSPQSPTELETVGNLLVHIKSLLRRRAVAAAAFDTGAPSDSIRHFSKILDGRRGVPHTFAATCFLGRAAAYKAAGRITDAIADCNRALSIDPTSIPALRARADLMEGIRAFSDCLRDLDHLKMLYDAILRDRKLPGPAWRLNDCIRYRDVSRDLRRLSLKIQDLRQMMAKGGGLDVDYYGLIGVRRGCSKSELERAHLLLSLRHRPEKAVAFVERLDFADERRDLDVVRDQAKMSGLVLFRLVQKGYMTIMANVVKEEAAERQRIEKANEAKVAVVTSAPVFQGVFCRDLAVVGSMLSHAGFSQSIPVIYEALRC